ncbi:MAG: hypothetical protein IPG44_11785 [Anaerolineales bacterium]|nr:hypothetical protein [Anaerolineales bacterium]
MPTATPAFTATPELTGTPSVPEVTVSVNTNCRTGPGTAYQIIGALVIGQKGIVVGKNSPTGYWIINNPGSTGTCWLFPQYATVSGDTSKLQEYAIPPTPTPTFTSTPTATPTLASPAPVNNVNITMVCTPDGINFKHSGTLTWEDKSNNEDGFNIYVNGIDRQHSRKQRLVQRPAGFLHGGRNRIHLRSRSPQRRRAGCKEERYQGLSVSIVFEMKTKRPAETRRTFCFV